MKKNVRPNRSTAQDSLTADGKLSASNDSLSDISDEEGSAILKKIKKNLKPLRSIAQGGWEMNQSVGAEDYGEKTETQQDSLSTCSELSTSRDSLSDNTKSVQRSGILKEMKKKLRPIRPAQSAGEASRSESTEDEGEETYTQKGRLTAHSELSASLDSLSDTSNAEGPGILMKMKKNLRPVRSTARGCRDVNQSVGNEDHGEETETQQISSDANSMDPQKAHSTTETEAHSNTQKKGRKLAGVPRKYPKPSERSLPLQENESMSNQLSASDDSLQEVSNKEKGDKLTDWLRRAAKPAEHTRPAQEDESTCNELSANSDGVLDMNAKEKGGMFSGIFKTKSHKPAERTLPSQEDESIHSKLSASNDSLSDINTKEKVGMFGGMFKTKHPKLDESAPLAQDDKSIQSGLSASNDSLSDISTKEKGGMFSGMFRKPQKTSRDHTPAPDSLSTHSELSGSNDSLSDINTKEKVGMFGGMFRTKHPKPDESAPLAQDDKSIQSGLSASNDSLSDISTKEKGGMFSGMFRKPQKTSRDHTPAPDSLSTHSELSGSNDSLYDNNTETARKSSQLGSTVDLKEETDDQQDKVLGGLFWKVPKDRTSTFTSYVTEINMGDEKSRPDNKQISSDADSVDPQQTHGTTETELDAPNDAQKKGGKLAGLFRKSPKTESTIPAQEDESIRSELSASNDSLSDISTKEKGGMFSGMFKSKSPKRSRDPTLAQDNLPAHSKLSGSKDSLFDDTQIGSDADSVDPQQTHSTTETELDVLNSTQKKGGKLVGLFRKGTLPAQEDESIQSELSASNDSLSDINTKEKGGKLAGLFRKSPTPAMGNLPAQEDESIRSELSASNDSLSDINTKQKGGMFSGMFRSKSPKRSKDPTFAQVSMDMEGGTLTGGDGMKKESRRPNRRVSFRVTRTLPRIPKITVQSPIQDIEEEEPLQQSFEMMELPSVQEGSVEVQVVEIEPLPSEINPLDTTEDDDDGLLDWWRTVEGWNEWNESSNFKEDEEELAIEQAADRVYLAAQLFVRLFNQRGASLQKRILELLTLADSADSFHKRALKASMGGRVASVVGSVTTITGLILAPFTFGSSIIVTAVGIGVATAGTITSASAHITDSVQSTLGRKKVEKMIEGYQEEIKDIRECMDFVQEGMHTLQGWNFEQYTDSVAKRALNRNIKHVVKEGARAGKALMINTDKLVSTVQVLSVAGGAAKAAQAISITTGVMSALFLALDIFFLAKDSHDLRKGAKTKFAKKLREVCKELQDGLLELNKVKSALQKTMDGIEVEEVEDEDEEGQEEDEEDMDLASDPVKLAQLEEEINQIEQKLDKEVLEKKKEGEVEGRKEFRRNSKDDLVKPQGEKLEKAEKESMKEERELRVEKGGKAESGGGKCKKDEMSKGGHQDDGNEDRRKEKREGDVKGERKREGDEHRKSGKEERMDKQSKKERREQDECRTKANIESEEQSKKERREQDECRTKAKIESDERGKMERREQDEYRTKAKIESEEQGKKERREQDEYRTKTKIESDERGKMERREQDEWRTKAKMESGQRRKKEPKEEGEQWKYVKRDSVPPPARPRSKAISSSTKETGREEPDMDPKASPRAARPKRRDSQREPLSI